MDFFVYFLKKYLVLVEGQLLYNIVLISAIHQHKSAIGIRMSPASLPILSLGCHGAPA